ncbi:MAG TPA: hypothetical protein VM389_11010 [Phycisphaerae bacterium]|nr:hypothetical protein [Phycisphaerae bacterium]
MKVLRGIIAATASLMLIGVQLVCYVAIFGELMRLAALLHFIDDLQEEGGDWSLLVYGAVFHFLVGTLLFLVLVRIRYREGTTIDWGRAPLVFLGVVNHSGLAAICVFSLCSGAALLTSFVLPITPGISCGMLCLSYGLGWIPFSWKAWQSAERLKPPLT